MTSSMIELIGALLGGGLLTAMGKGWFDRSKGLDQISAEREKTHAAAQETRLIRTESEKEELQEELMLRVEREGELHGRNLLLKQELDTMRRENAELREHVRLKDETTHALTEENKELRVVLAATEARCAALSSEIMTLRRASDQRATIMPGTNKDKP